MLIVAGPHAKSGRIQNSNILDFAPTVLSLLGHPVPAGMEGKPLEVLG
jgi:arylsulfatase A-like enzyme